MTKIFISYRRDDSAGQAGRLYDHLVKRYGEDEVFMDVDGIDLGERFEAVLQAALAGCDLMLVIMGRSWAQLRDPGTGRRRIELDDDWVRREVVAAMARGVPVIPVLVHGAALPAPEELPPDLVPLLGRQAIVLDDRKWTGDVQALVKRLEAIPRRREQQALASRIARIGPRRFAAIAAALVLAVATAGWMQWPVEMPDLVGQPLAAARQAIGTAGLLAGEPEVTESESMAVPAGHVIEQVPPLGVRVNRLQRVKLVVAKLPPPVDLSRHVHIRDTGTEGTIGATAAAMAMEVAFDAGGRPVRLSERYLYERSKRRQDFEGDEGTYMSAIVWIAEQYGAPPLARWPYVAGQRQLPEGTSWEQLDQAAEPYRVRFTRLGGLDDVYGALRNGRPVLASVKAGRAWDSETAAKTGAVDAALNTRDEGIMAIVIVGFDPAEGTYRFANSWGAGWGDRGFGSMSRASAQALLVDGEWWAVEPAAR